MDIQQASDIVFNSGNISDDSPQMNVLSPIKQGLDHLYESRLEQQQWHFWPIKSHQLPYCECSWDENLIFTNLHRFNCAPCWSDVEMDLVTSLVWLQVQQTHSDHSQPTYHWCWLRSEVKQAWNLTKHCYSACLLIKKTNILRSSKL